MIRPLSFVTLLVSVIGFSALPLTAQKQNPNPPATTAHLRADSPPDTLYAAAKPLRSIPARHAEARRLFEWAAAAGHVLSMQELADMIASGQGGNRDGDRALALFRQAADTGDVPAMLRLASLHFRPIVGSYSYASWRDLPAGQALVEKAAATGDIDALERLAQILESGTGGVRDVARSLETWEKVVAAGRTKARESRDRVRDNLRFTPEQKLTRYRTELERAAKQPNPTQARGFALSRYIGSVYGGGLEMPATAAIVKPIIAEMIETDFHAIYDARTVSSLPWSELFNEMLTADQKQVLTQIGRHRSRHQGVVAPEISPGQGWSAIYSEAQRPAVAATPASPPATPAAAVAAKPAPRPAAPAAASTDELSAVTREAKNWQEFFAASARRPEVFHQSHQPDVALFLRRHAATPEQLRAAYRAAHAGLRLTVGSARGREAGAQFVAYQTALLQAGLSDPEAVAYVRDDFLNLVSTDIYNAYQALMGVRDAAVEPLRALIPPSLQQEFRDLAARHANREPVPQVGTAVAASAAPPDSLVGHWSYSASLFSQSGRPSQRIEGILRFNGSGHVVNGVVFGPFSANPTRDSALLSGETNPLTGQVRRTLRFNQGELVFDSMAHPQLLAGNIARGQNIIGSWQAARRPDYDHVARARALGNSPEAIAAYTEAIKLAAAPDHYFARGNLHYDARNNEAAIADYDAVLKADPGHVNARFNRMLALYYARQHERALTEVDHLLDKKMLQGEQLANAHFMRGEILWWLKRHDESEAAYAAAIKLAPRFAERTRAANTREGRLAEIVERSAEVNAIFARMDEGIKKSTDQLRAANQASLNASRQTSATAAPAGAAAAAEIPLVGPSTLTPSLEPDRALETTLPQLGEAWEEARGRPERFAPSVDELIRLFPQRIEPLVAKAQILSDRPADRAEARALLERAIALDPLHPQIHLGLAQLDIAEGERARALRRMREMAVLRPRSLSLAVFEANLLNELHAPADERRAMRARLVPLIQAAPPDDRERALHASIYLALGAEDHQDALADLNAAIALRRQPPPDLLLQRAQVHERLKDYPSALADYRQLLDGPLGTNSRQAAQLRQRIAQIEQLRNAAATKEQPTSSAQN